MHTADRRWRTIRATGREWRDLARSRRAFERQRPSKRFGGVTFVGNPADRPQPEQETHQWRLWLAQPDKVRTEFSIDHDAVTAVIVGDTWWSWSPQRGARTNHGNPRSSHGWGPGQILIDPSVMLPAVELEVLGRTTFVGRPTIEVLAAPSEIDDNDEEAPYRRSAAGGADEYALMVDGEFGILLRNEARIDGKPFRITEMLSIQFDQRLDEDVFLPPPHSDLEAASTSLPRWVNIQELQDAVPFTVVVPEHPPFGASAVSIDPPSGPDDVSERVHISYASDVYGEERQHFWLVESDEALVDTRAVDWDTTTGMRFGEDRQVEPPVRVVQLERLGTYVEVSSYFLEMDQLLDLARSLVPLGSEPPTLK